MTVIGSLLTRSPRRDLVSEDRIADAKVSTLREARVRVDEVEDRPPLAARVGHAPVHVAEVVAEARARRRDALRPPRQRLGALLLEQTVVPMRSRPKLLTAAAGTQRRSAAANWKCGVAHGVAIGLGQIDQRDEDADRVPRRCLARPPVAQPLPTLCLR